MVAVTKLSPTAASAVLSLVATVDALVSADTPYNERFINPFVTATFGGETEGLIF